VRIGLQAFGRKFDVVLHRSDGIVGRDFAHVSTSSVNGSTILRKSDIDHCFYHGVLVGEPSSSITGYTCGDGLEGSIRTELGEHYVVMPSSRVHELQVAASTLRHARSEGQLPQHVVFRTSDHMLWREDDRACERGAAWRQADSPPPNRSADAPGGALAGHSDRAPSAAALAPMQGCTCLAAWGHLGRWYPGGGCQDPAGDGGSWCFTEDECGFGGGSSWISCARSDSGAPRRRAQSSEPRRRAQSGTQQIVELTMVNDHSQFESHQAAAGQLSTFDMDPTKGGRARVGSGGEQRSAQELTQERNLQLVNAMNEAYRSMGEGISITLVGVRTFEDTAAEISEGLYAADVNGEMGDSIDSYLDKLSEWRLTMQPQYLAQMGINLASDQTTLITARDQLATGGAPSTNGVAGLAWVGSMCDVKMSASVNEDMAGSTWQWAAETVTHEMGHNFGAGHDGENEAANCPNSGFVMVRS
jgi:hypothetical protein